MTKRKTDKNSYNNKSEKPSLIFSVIELLRPEQWYKNLVVFLAVIFSGNLFVESFFLKVCLAFIALCLISSAGYAVNDIADYASDRNHPRKRQRPVASKRISVPVALFIACVLFCAAVWLGYCLSSGFMYCILFLFFMTQLYSFFLKKEIFADIIAIGINFIVRAVAGAVVIGVWISPWLILGPFFLSLFLSAGKRYAELRFFRENAHKQRGVLFDYNASLIEAVLIISTSCLIISYALYSFLSIQKWLIVSLPFAVYGIFRYFQIIYSGSDAAHYPQKVFKDLRILIALLFWIVSVIIVVYLIPK